MHPSPVSRLFDERPLHPEAARSPTRCVNTLIRADDGPRSDHRLQDSRQDRDLAD